ncbi:MAG TPA: DNA alkylation repair protein [Clostridia bacterium]|nr:DNA alkylation repair protein [Clostridia bacterium]
MYDIIERAKAEIADLNERKPTGTHVKTGDIRKLSAALYRKLPDKSIDNVLVLCEALLDEHKWETGVIAYDWADRSSRQYSRETYSIFFSWLKKYVRGWGDCDDFCTHAFGKLLMKYKELFANVLEWTKDDDFWVRRAAAVILIPSISRNDYANLAPFEIADRLMNDSNELVLKGYGWMLKVLSKADEKGVTDYLVKNSGNMPRVSFRYAIEKFDEEKRSYLLGL